MDNLKSFASKLYPLNEQSFSDIALELFQFQAVNNSVYKEYISHLSINPAQITRVDDIPFFPIAFFKTHNVQTGTWHPETFFSSSGTTNVTTSKHAVRDNNFYLEHSKRCFEHFYGSLKDYHFLALLPSYLERTGSSLIAMIDYFIKESQSTFSGFYLHETEKLLNDLIHLKSDSRKTILWGVSFALLDLAEQHEVDLSHCMIIETGGMKGRRKEITRAELHDILRLKLNARFVLSEYGMTELFSQAYTNGKFTFTPSPWMKIIGRDISDPFHKGVINETAGINIIDLANYNTISFIETEDLGKVYDNNTFEVLGRIDNSEARGCNLML